MIQNETAHCPAHQVYVGRTFFSFFPSGITHLIMSSLLFSCLLLLLQLCCFSFLCVFFCLCCQKDDGLALFFLLILNVMPRHESCCLLAPSPPCSLLCRHPMQLEVRLRRRGGIEGREGGRERDREMQQRAGPLCC